MHGGVERRTMEDHVPTAREATMILIAFVCVILSIVPWALYLGQERGTGPQWGLVAAGERVLGTGAYREQRVMCWERGSAPRVVRAAALTGFYLGQMVIPGAFAAFAGIAVLLEPSPVWVVLELSAPTGLLVASFLLTTGWAMLEADPLAADRARRAARWAFGHNVALLGALGVAVAADPAGSDAAILPCVYACASLAQAALMMRAAGSLDAYHAAQRQMPAPIQDHLAALESA